MKYWSVRNGFPVEPVLVVPLLFPLIVEIFLPISPRGAFLPPGTLILLSVAFCALIGMAWIRWRPKYIYDHAELTQLIFGKRKRHAWAGLVDLARQEGENEGDTILFFKTGTVNVKQSDVHGSRLVAHAMQILGMEFDAPSTQTTPSALAMKVRGLEYLGNNRLVIICGSLIFAGSIIALSADPQRYSWALNIPLMAVFIVCTRAGWKWELDDTGIQRSWFGLFKNRIEWSRIEFLTYDYSLYSSRGTLWAGFQRLDFELLDRVGPTLSDELQARLPESAILFLNKPGQVWVTSKFVDQDSQGAS